MEKCIYVDVSTGRSEAVERSEDGYFNFLALHAGRGLKLKDLGLRY
jgi:hypothetical protein